MRRHLLDRELEPADDGGGDAAFWASPVGRAARAKIRGDRFFQIELDDASMAAYAEASAAAGGGRRVRRTCDLLGQIEELGWHLEHVSWWRADEPGYFDDGARPDPDPVHGVYLFHSLPDIGEDAAPAGAGHAPSHRREVG